MTKTIHSEINGTLEITLRNGKKVLDSETANYSYGSLQRVLDYGLSKIYFDNKAKILLLGLGGGSVIQTLIKKYYHSGHITAIEIDPVIIELAKSEFNVTENKNLAIISENALDYIQDCKSSFDLIIIDLFIDLNVPNDFYKPLFWDQLIPLLKPKGNVLFNAGIQLDDHDYNTQSIISKHSNQIEFHLHNNVHGTNTLLIGRKK